MWYVFGYALCGIICGLCVVKYMKYIDSPKKPDHAEIGVVFLSGLLLWPLWIGLVIMDQAIKLIDRLT